MTNPAFGASYGVAPKRTVTHQEIMDLDAWLHRVPYSGIRQAESPHSSSTPDGKRVRGVLLAAGLCLSRAKQFYALVPDSRVAIPLTHEEVLSRYTVPTLVRLYAMASAQARATRR